VRAALASGRYRSGDMHVGASWAGSGCDGELDSGAVDCFEVFLVACQRQQMLAGHGGVRYGQLSTSMGVCTMCGPNVVVVGERAYSTPGVLDHRYAATLDVDVDVDAGGTMNKV
jgi:hypothetical protein